jgi:hypothetical protein
MNSPGGILLTLAPSLSSTATELESGFGLSSFFSS